MGLLKQDCELLYYAKNALQVSFQNTLTLGRLELFIRKKELTELFKTQPEAIDKLVGDLNYSEPVISLLGAEHIDSLDYSDYEGASIIHDMNKALPSKYDAKYSAIIDGGTIEHVFNFPIAIRNCMKALTIGGHYIGITPANNQMGHGFYQFSPELYFRVFSKENGFEVVKILLRVGEKLFELKDPSAVKSRVELTNSYSTTMIIIAKKIDEKEIFKNSPQQSDYVNTWSINNSVKNNEMRVSENVILHWYRRLIPYWLKNIIRKFINIFVSLKTRNDELLGDYNPEHFKQIYLK